MSGSAPLRVRSPPERHVAFLGIAIGCVLSGCGAEEEAPAFEVQDSTGIRIAVSNSPQWSRDGEAWRVDSASALRMGVQEGEPEYQFFGLSDATRLPDGTLVASNVGSSELRFYSPEGDFVRSVGRRGAGPGEFGQFSSLRVCPMRGDRLAVEDAANDRINVFDHEGEYISTFRLEAGPESGGRPAQVVGCVSEDLLLGHSYPGGGILRGDPGDIIDGEVNYVAVDTTGGIAVDLARVATRPRFVNEAGGVVHYPYIPLSPERLSASGRGSLYLSRNGSASVERRDERGEVTSIARWVGVDREAVPSIWSRFVDESLAEIQRENTRRRYARLYAQDLPLPDSTPALQELMLDAEGNLWAERYRLPWTRARLWDVLDPQGQWLGAVELPAVADVFEIGSDYVLAREIDDLGVERLLMFRLVKRDA